MEALSRAVLATALAAALYGCGGSSSSPNNVQLNKRPDYIVGNVYTVTYDGNSDDLLTAGLGKSGLAGAAPAVANATAPTVAELRRLAIYNNYRALVDVAANGGYGTLYGPNVAADGTVTSGEGKIAGDESIAYADDGTGKQNVTMMVQVPSTFTVANACIVTAASSGSRGVYGAIGTAGEWGLKHGCAVAYTDKGSGNGGFDIAANATYNIFGQRLDATSAGFTSQFTPGASAAALASFNATSPNRWAYKHAHSQQNPEKDWGRDTLRAVEFAFYILNQKFGAPAGYEHEATLDAGNTLVIASSVSNGAAAAIQAAELDTSGLIDGVAVAEPQINLNPPASLVIKRGGTNVPSFAHPLMDYFTWANLYEPCASLSTANNGNTAGLLGVTTPNAAAAANRCAALAANGLVSGATTQEQANDALNKMLSYGWETDSIPFQPSHYSLAVLAVTLTYANAYAKASVTDNLCGYSFAATSGATGQLITLPASNAAQLFATGNGVPPSGGVNIVNNNSAGGALADAFSISPSTGKADLNFDGALCLRNLWTGSGATATAVRASVDAIKVKGTLHGKPAVIVHGRSDTLCPVNQTSRPYYALNKTVEGGSSNLYYYEVTNAQHFDTFIDNAAAPGYDSRLVPLHRYFIQAMDIMYANLKNGTPIPPSQVVRTTPRGGTAGAAPAITAANVPPIATAPAAGNAITFSGNTLTIPE